ncbi:MAG: hypothetical protein SGARI_003921, partial [Bacillariaceae sp.]
MKFLLESPSDKNDSKNASKSSSKDVLEEETLRDFVPMCKQGFEPSSTKSDEEEYGHEDFLDMESHVAGDGSLDEFEFRGTLFRTGYCYHDVRKPDNPIVIGIKSITVEEGKSPSAICVMIARVTDTFLGQDMEAGSKLYSSVDETTAPL